MKAASFSKHLSFLGSKILMYVEALQASQIYLTKISLIQNQKLLFAKLELLLYLLVNTRKLTRIYLGLSPF